MASNYYVYIMASWKRVLYIGVTNDLQRRAWQHRTGAVPGFTSRYAITRFVYIETYADPRPAIAREKELKGWRRDKKVALIESTNPEWRDLYSEISE